VRLKEKARAAKGHPMPLGQKQLRTKDESKPHCELVNIQLHALATCDNEDHSPHASERGLGLMRT